MSASREAPMDAWIDYAKCSGLLDAEGVAPDSARAQTAWNAYTAAWNAATRAATSAHSARWALSRPADATPEEWIAAVKLTFATARALSSLQGIPSHWLEAMRDYALPAKEQQ
jgi:hypothetical protein